MSSKNGANRSYRRLVYEDRVQIYALLKEGLTQTEIAARLGVSQGSVSREITRNRGQRGYRFKQAQEKAELRDQAPRQRTRKLTSKIKPLIIGKLRTSRWSPEQICYWLAEEHDLLLSHETIYLMVRADRQAGGDLYTYLRRRGKKRNRQSGKNAGRGLIPGRIDIAERPGVVEKRKRLGDWEGDTIIGKNHQGGLLTHVERKTLYTTIAKLPRTTAHNTHRATLRGLLPLRKHVHTITYDNGKEFAAHQLTGKHLKADIFFAEPYKAWQRAINENTNGLIRDFFPKGTDFDKVHPATVAKVQRMLNNRPRKTLNYQTPEQAFKALAKAS
jgi:IS30 family transposase